MIRKDLLIINKLGLHARAAAKLAKTAGQFAAKIQVSLNGNEVDGKSVMSLMLLAAVKGTTIKVSTEGKDEQEAMTAIENLINGRFDEDE